MSYEAPRLTAIQPALVAIQGGKDNMAQTDSEFLFTVPAYQADE
jgi:hypothetical protein